MKNSNPPSFRGEYYFLSNVYPLKDPIEVREVEGQAAPTVEHAYQAAKFVNESDKLNVLDAKTGGSAKTIARKLIEAGAEVDSHWQDRKLGVMRYYVNQKFKNDVELATLLVQTGQTEIVEGNPWNDNYWGRSPIDNVEGANWLGKILMDVREQIQVEQAVHPEDHLHPAE